LQCPLWVISGHFAVQSPCPLYPQKRTFERQIKLLLGYLIGLRNLSYCFRGSKAQHHDGVAPCAHQSSPSFTTYPFLRKMRPNSQNQAFNFQRASSTKQKTTPEDLATRWQRSEMRELLARAPNSLRCRVQPPEKYAPSSPAAERRPSLSLKEVREAAAVTRAACRSNRALRTRSDRFQGAARSA